MSARSRLRSWKLELARSAADMSDPSARRRAWWHLMFFDHGFLRVFWTNRTEFAPGVWRANQPGPGRWDRYASKGIKTVLNLRGASEEPHYNFERQACDRLGLTLIDLPALTARTAPDRANLIAVLDAMRAAEKPLLIHCKSGADRTSLAAAIYLLAVEGADLATARRQFSPRFIHFKWTKTGVLDHILDTFEAEQAQSGMDFETWLRTKYDGAATQAAFDEGRTG